MKTFRKILAIVLALATFVGLGVFVLAINDWGQTAPSEGAQMIWGFVLATWPFIVGVTLWPKD